MISVREAARWYGEVIALNGITCEIGPGAVGLLGPNGAGKTTLLRLITGLMRPTSGEVRVLGEPVWGNTALRRKLGYCPETDRFYEGMTGHQFVTLMTRLHGFTTHEAQQRSASALERVGLPLDEGGATKAISAYSKGMRQKVKVAQALAHEPQVIVLDEPLTGADPVSRKEISDLCRALADEGRTVLLSSHVLHEVERVTKHFVLIDKGRLLAEGEVHEIRELIDQHPHRIEVVCDRPRALAATLLEQACVRSAEVLGERTLVLQTADPDACYAEIPRAAARLNLPIHRLVSPDNNLEAVFRYLTGRR